MHVSLNWTDYLTKDHTHHFSILKTLSSMLLSEFNDDIRKTYCNEIDFDQAGAELKLLPSIIKQCLPEVKQVTSMDTVFSVASNGQNGEYLLSNVVRLLHIYLLDPMSAATTEWSFSVQRRVKSYLRNITTERRYNNLLMLNIHKERTDSNNLIELAKEFIPQNDKRLRFFCKVKSYTTDN